MWHQGGLSEVINAFVRRGVVLQAEVQVASNDERTPSLSNVGRVVVMVCTTSFFSKMTQARRLSSSQWFTLPPNIRP